MINEAGRRARRLGSGLPGIGAILTLALAWTAGSPAALEITQDAVPGGVVGIPLLPASQSRPVVRFGQKKVLVMEFASEWVGVVGLPLSLVPGQYIVQARGEGEDEATVHEFTVFPRRTASPAVVELPEIPAAHGVIDFDWRDDLEASFPLSPPAPGPALPYFGRYRRASASRSMHVDFVGFDITADTRVTAPGDGRIAATTNDNGEPFLWIDHGMGLYTRMGPLSDVSHRTGQPVEAGQAVGRVMLDTEDTPRTLYWTVFLNGAAVDPFLVSEIQRAAIENPPAN